MNRIQSSTTEVSPIGLPAGHTPSDALPAHAPAGAASHVGHGRYRAIKGDAPAAFFAPLHYEPNYAYPLLIWLHGPCDDEGQLKRVMPHISLRNYVGVAPRGPRREDRAAGRATYSWSQSPGDLVVAEQRLFEALETVQAQFHVSPRRLFLAGFACGGTMAFRLAMSHPDRFAGVLSLCGEFPSGQTPLGRLSDARRVPIFLACGRDSHVYPGAAVCDNLKLFHSAGMDVSLRQYPCGQEITPAMLGDMDRWIMEQVTGGTSA
jgi:phospholipase/carboxylesterase